MTDRSITLNVTPEEAQMIHHLRAGLTPGVTVVHLIAERPGEDGTNPSTVDIFLTVTDDTMLTGGRYRPTFEAEVRALVAPWLDVHPRNVYSAEERARRDARELAQEQAHDARELAREHERAMTQTRDARELAREQVRDAREAGK